MTKILIIDDNLMVSKLLDEALTVEGFQVAVAFDANDGYTTAIEYLPDLILLDVKLPDIAGFDLCRVLKNHKELNNVPIIMITGTARSTEDKVKGFQMGIDDYVVKPFEMPELVERIKAVLRRTQAPRPSSQPQVPASKIPVIPPPPASAAGKPSVTTPAPTSSVLSLVANLLFNPSRFPANAHLPRISTLFLFALLGLVFGGLMAAAGTPTRPALVVLLTLLIWGVLVAVLVMASSLLGIALSWKDGSRILSLAMVPVLFKMAGALAMSLWTTLSPLYFTASPMLLIPKGPRLLERFDFFELWAVFLLLVLVKTQPGSTKNKARVVTGLVWLTSVTLALAIGRFGGGP